MTEEKATKHMVFKPRTFHRWQHIKGRDRPEHTNDEMANAFMDLWEREQRMEEVDE